MVRPLWGSKSNQVGMDGTRKLHSKVTVSSM